MQAHKPSTSHTKRRPSYNQRAPEPRRHGLPAGSLLIDFRDFPYRHFFEGDIDKPFPNVPQVTRMTIPVPSERAYIEHPQDSDDHGRLVLHRPATNWWSTHGDYSLTIFFSEPFHVVSMSFFTGEFSPFVGLAALDEKGNYIDGTNKSYDDPGWLTFDWQPNDPFYGLSIDSMSYRGEPADIDFDYILLG